MSQQSDLLAVLVDADNVSPSRIGGVLAEIATYGTASVKRVYGDWTKSQLRGWKDAASAHVIQPMQQFDNTTGKNATDSALIIDAMDLLYTRRFQGFCIVSSDSDFTRLASRIREEGVTVYGFGERKTPEAFRNACDQFTYLEVLGVVDEPDAAPSTTSARWTPGALRSDAKLVSLLRGSVENASADDGWADLGTVGQLMRKQQPDFDPRNWGYAKLSDLLKAVGLFTIESKPGGMSLRPQAAKTTRTTKTVAGGADGGDESTPDAVAPERTSKRTPKKRATARTSGDEGADAARRDTAAAPAASASTDPTGSPDDAVVEAAASAAEGGVADDATSGAGATSRARKKSTRSKAAGGSSARSSAASAAEAAEADPADATPPTGDAEAPAESSAPRASSGTVSRQRGARPIEQLTLGAALDAALDAVSNAARGNTANVSVDAAESAPSLDAGGDEPGAAGPGAAEPGADESGAAAPATRPKRASRRRAEKPAAAATPEVPAAADAPAAPATATAAPEAPAAAATEASAAPAQGEGSAPAAGKRAPRRASRPGTAAS